jgi:hypothetical protein
VNLLPPKNENYAATVVRVRSINELAGLDNLVGVPVFGYQALTTKDVQLDSLMVVFTAETQLSDAYAFNNNLFRHAYLNLNEEVKGYLEDNRRVKAIKLRGHRSDALIMPLASLKYTGVDVTQLQEGDTFDELNGQEICRKFQLRPVRVPGQQVANQSVVRVTERAFPLHIDTANYFRNTALISTSDEVVITQKLHGTSVRIGHVPVQRKLSRAERVVKWIDRKLFRGKLNVKIEETEYAYVYGSRRVVKDPDNPFETGFYKHDVYSEVGQRLRGLLPKGFVVYGEIIGWAGSQAIQPGYTYQLPKGTNELYVYRVTFVTPDGRQVDLPWNQVKTFCAANGLKVVPEIDVVTRNFYGTPDALEDWVQRFMDQRFVDLPLWGEDAVPTEEGTVDEGVALRVDTDRLTPLILKAKSPIFLGYETEQLDSGVDADADVEWTEVQPALPVIDGEVLSVETVEESPVKEPSEPVTEEPVEETNDQPDLAVEIEVPEELTAPEVEQFYADAEAVVELEVEEPISDQSDAITENIQSDEELNAESNVQSDLDVELAEMADEALVKA